MNVFQDAWVRTDLPQQTVVCVGNFDGVHRGQQAVLQRVIERATISERTSVVVTFEPHPRNVLRPEVEAPRLTTPGQKLELLGELGLDVVAVIRFDRSFAATSAREFADEFLFERLCARELYVGSQFTFGKNQEGNLEFLQELGRSAGCEVTGVPEVLDGGAPISSTRIRAAVAVGAIEEATRLMGRRYRLRGVVVRGAARGRTLGWPTINLQAEDQLLPGNGVYVSRVVLGGGEAMASVTNIGLRPTLHDDPRPSVESHILDFRGNLYGESVDLEIVARLRDERKFSSVDELREQIGRDVQAAREILNAVRPSEIHSRVPE